MDDFMEKWDQFKDWKVRLFHVEGLDGMSHATYLNSPEVQKGVLHTEDLIRKVVDKMDDDSVLICVGDHGVRFDGDHGGDSIGEYSTVFFAYQKKPFPMAKYYRENLEKFQVIDHDFK